MSLNYSSKDIVKFYLKDVITPKYLKLKMVGNVDFKIVDGNIETESGELNFGN